MQQKNIHWYPGHMAKAFNEIESRLKVVDVVVEIGDSRTPLSSINPFLEKLIANKKKLLVFSKKDLCDESKIKPFEEYYHKAGYEVMVSSLNNPNEVKSIANQIMVLGKDIQQKYISRGMKVQPLRVMILGIPNVGKSTLINKLCGRKSASVQNTPGHTRAQQWIRINNNFDLLDTPGILPPHYEDETIALHLALVGSLKENILPQSELYEYLITFLKSNYSNYLSKRYNVDESKTNAEITLSIAQNRKLLLKGGVEDIEGVERLVLKEFKEGILGKVIIDSLC